MNSLAIPEMIQLSTPILTNGTRQHAALASVPTAFALAPILENAQSGLLALDDGADVGKLGDQLRSIVEQHDHLVRCFDLRMRAEIAAVTDASERATLERAREAVLPEGQTLVQASDAAKGGERTLRAERVSEETLAVLATVATRGGRTLADHYGELQAVGLRLGEVQAERALRVAELAGPRVREARKRWVAAVEVIDQAMRAAGVDPSSVLGPIRAAQKRSTPEPETPAPAPAETAPAQAS